jgi:hypothetical protein
MPLPPVGRFVGQAALDGRTRHDERVQGESHFGTHEHNVAQAQYAGAQKYY